MVGMGGWCGGVVWWWVVWCGSEWRGFAYPPHYLSPVVLRKNEKRRWRIKEKWRKKIEKRKQQLGYVWWLYVKGNVEADKQADKGAKMPPIENKIYKGVDKFIIIKPNHMCNSFCPAVAPSNKVGKKKENPQKIPQTSFEWNLKGYLWFSTTLVVRDETSSKW
jgi:hypothetical protein